MHKNVHFWSPKFDKQKLILLRLVPLKKSQKKSLGSDGQKRRFDQKLRVFEMGKFGNLRATKIFLIHESWLSRGT